MIGKADNLAPRLLRSAVAGVGLAALCAGAAPFEASMVRAQGVDLKGRQITVAVGTATGGAYDIYSRLVGRHLGRFLAGTPNLVTVNMPGAGGLIMANWLANIAPKDGTAIGIVPSAAAFEGLLGNSRARFDARGFRWLASLNDYAGVAIVWHATPFYTAQDLITKESVIGGGGTSSDVTIWPNLFNSLVGTRIKLVSGYVGTSTIALAMERGEVQGVIGADWDGWKASKPDWIRDKKLRVIVQIALTRHPDLIDVPSVLDFAKNPDDRAVLELLISRQKYSRAFATSPGSPEPVVAALREAFARMASDAAFLADTEKAGVTVHFAPGPEIQAWVDKVYAYPRATIDRATAELRNTNQ
jgi:tripartite-type tricarboxylate transporter receptor subunit TctC